MPSSTASKPWAVAPTPTRSTITYIANHVADANGDLRIDAIDMAHTLAGWDTGVLPSAGNFDGVGTTGPADLAVLFGSGGDPLTDIIFADAAAEEIALAVVDSSAPTQDALPPRRPTTRRARTRTLRSIHAPQPEQRLPPISHRRQSSRRISEYKHDAPASGSE